MFSYRCVNRCKRYPTVREGVLNETVWTAVKESLQRPDVIAAGIKTMVKHSQNEIEPNAQYDSRALEQIAAEESRVLQAYRIGIINVEQLGIELKSLQARKMLIDSCKPKQRTAVDTAVVGRSLQDYCRVVSERLESASWDQRKEILHHLLAKVIFEGDQVRIVGRVSIPPQNSAVERTRNTGDGPFSGEQKNEVDRNDLHVRDIAGTTSLSKGRNSADQIDSFPFPRETEWDASFELVTPVYKDLSAKIAASRANLIKANAARWKHHSRPDS